MKDEILIRGIINGEESAIDQAMKKYSKLLWSIVGPVLNRVASVEDVEEPRDIAQAMGLPVKQVENRLYRTKRKLRKQLERKA